MKTDRHLFAFDSLPDRRSSVVGRRSSFVVRQPQTALPGPDNILRRTLPNGITVLAKEVWSAPSVVIEGYLLAGNLDEPADLAGLASFTTGMLNRGTRRHAFTEINELIESVGASIGFGTDRQTVSFSTKSLVEDLNLVLGILTEELREPVFPAEHVEKMRGLRMTAIAERENDTRQMASLTFRELMYGDHPLGRNMLGTRETNAAIGRDALVQFYETYFAPQEMVIAIVGALEAEDAVARVAAAFGDWCATRPSRPKLPPFPVLDGRRERRHAMPDKTQTDIVLGWPAMHRLAPDFDGARLANTVLGVFGMMGRLGVNVRERNGMAYYAYSRLSADRHPGTWTAAAGVNPANVERALAAILDEIRRLRDEPVPAAELEDSKRYLTGSLPLQLETNDGIASVLVDLEWQQLGLDYVGRYVGIINSLTAAAVQAAAQKYLDPERFVLAVAGPA